MDHSFFLTQEESLTKLAQAIREKSNSNSSLTFPDGMISQLENIGIKIVQGSVTFEEKQKAYLFLEDPPDIFILYLAEAELVQTETISCIIQISKKETYTIGYNNGILQYYSCFKNSSGRMGAYQNGTDFAGTLGPYTYNYIGIYF